MTYYSVHDRLKRTRGKATSLECAQCGSPALDWAYQHTSEDEKVDPATGRVYSDDPSDYEPMCRKCHRKFDSVSQERIRESDLANGKRVGSATAARWRADPDAAREQQSRAGAIGIQVALKRMREDPELREKRAAAARANAKKARARLAEKRAAEKREQLS